jgi:hypothetical protein
MNKSPSLQEIADMLCWRVSVLEQAIIDADKFPMALDARTILRTALENDHPPQAKKRARRVEQKPNAH